MKKIFLAIIMITCSSLTSFAGDGDKYFNLYGGWQGNAIKWNSNIINLMAGYEWVGKYHHAWEVYVDASTSYKVCPVHRVIDSKSFFDYKTVSVGIAYKPAFIKGKNSLLRWRIGADLGANDGGFQAGIDLGLEYSYTFRNQMQLFILQKNDIVFWSRDNFRNGLLIGIKFPLNR